MKRHAVFVAALLATLLMAVPAESQAFFFSFGGGFGGGWGGWGGPWWGGPGWWGPGYGYWHRPYYGRWHRPWYRRGWYPDNWGAWDNWGYMPRVLPQYPVLTPPAAPATQAPATSTEK
jgi:hypothetical protein